MNRFKLLIPLLIAAFALCLVLAACSEESTTITEAPVPTPEPPAECSTPVPVASSVANQATFSAQFSDGTSAIGWRQWTFEGGTPGVADAVAVTVRYPQVSPAAYSWTLRVCRDAPIGDPDVDCCASVGNLVSFGSSSQSSRADGVSIADPPSFAAVREAASAPSR